ncbi:putative inactive protein kinase [Sesbania bispinosa]|nr:putative inactive protein kinase [Sesbania bispinosa]
MAAMDIPAMGMVAGDKSPCNAEMMEANVCIMKFCHGSMTRNGTEQKIMGFSKSDITDSCSQMILQLHDVYDPNKINARIKIFPDHPVEQWLQKPRKHKPIGLQLKHEEKRCMEELQCNIVVCLSKMIPELGTPLASTKAGTSSASSSDPGTSPFFISEMNGAGIEVSTYRSDSDFSGNLREAIALSGNAPPSPPPLCSICQHKAPVFGKPLRWFNYAELELATVDFHKPTS